MSSRDESTEIVLFVRGTGDDLAGWNRRRIVDALVRETDVNIDIAETISKEVEGQIMRSGINALPSCEDGCINSALKFGR